MCASIRDVVEFGITDYLVSDRNEWIIKHPGQVVLNSSQVHWTMDVEKAMNEGGLQGITDYH
jgi:dynein heavy chain